MAAMANRAGSSFMATGLSSLQACSLESLTINCQ
jgi:hypothetical protein